LYYENNCNEPIRITNFSAHGGWISCRGYPTEIKSGEKIASGGSVTLKELGVNDIFICNCRENKDYLEMIDVLRAHDFTYILPISLNLSEEFDEPKTERRISYIEYMLEGIGRVNDSVFIVTDKHASLYEDMDAFITDMNSIAKTFTSKQEPAVNGENLVFVANNLYDYERANVPLVASLIINKPNKYPTMNFGEAYFLLDQFEDIGNWAYFQNHDVRTTTVENLLNFKANGPEKIVFIARILKVMKRQLDFSEYIGKQYTEYRRLGIETKLDTYLDALVNELIYQYNIQSVTAYRDPEPMTIDVVNTFDVWPVNCMEKVTVSRTVEVA
jgi:hypothetical protein